MKNVPALSVVPVSFRLRILTFVKRWSSYRQNSGLSNIIRQYTSALNVLRMIIRRFQKLRCLVRSSVTVGQDLLRSLCILPRWSTSTKFLAIARRQCGSLRDCRWLVNKCQNGWSTSSTISFRRCIIFYWKSWKCSDFFMWMKHLIILWLQKKPTLIIGLSQAENLKKKILPHLLTVTEDHPRLPRNCWAILMATSKLTAMQDIISSTGPDTLGAWLMFGKKTLSQIQWWRTLELSKKKTPSCSQAGISQNIFSYRICQVSIGKSQKLRPGSRKEYSEHLWKRIFWIVQQQRRAHRQRERDREKNWLRRKG